MSGSAARVERPVGGAGAKPVALLFPGQGSQFVGMGRDLAAAFPAARDLFQRADDALGFALTDLCWNGPDDKLTQTRNAQPAILAHSIAAWSVLADLALPVRIAAGHSLGEFSAYVAAGALTFEDAVRTVRLRGELMFRAGRERPGTMAAVVGLDDAALEYVCRAASAEGGVVVPANFNAPGQIVISGDTAAVQRAGELAREAGAKRVIPLNVSGAFHSPLVQSAQAGLREQLQSVTLSAARFPVVSNVTANPISDPETAADLLVRQLTSPVRWVANVQAMRVAGAEQFVELGPGSVLTGLLKRIDRGASGRALGTAPEVESFREEVVGWN